MSSDVNLNFKSISDFKWCMKRGGEAVFNYNGKMYGVFPKMKRCPDSQEQILVTRTCSDVAEGTGKWYDTVDVALEYMIDGVRLGDIITKVEVEERSL